MRKHQFFIFTVQLIIGTTIISGCKGENKTESQPTIERIRQNGVLLAGTTGDYHPLTFQEPDGSYTGFCIEVAESIAKELGVGIRFVPTSWPTLTADVLEEPQKFDLAIGGITITDKRLEIK